MAAGLHFQFPYPHHFKDRGEFHLRCLRFQKCYPSARARLSELTTPSTPALLQAGRRIVSLIGVVIVTAAATATAATGAYQGQQ